MDDQHLPESSHVQSYEACKQLQREVEDVIAPHKKDVQMPPFTAGELIVMTLICCDGTSAGKAMTDESILRSIVTSFKFYNARMHEEFSKRFDHGTTSMWWEGLPDADVDEIVSKHIRKQCPTNLDFCFLLGEA